MTESIAPYDENARRMAHEVVDSLFDHIQGIRSRPVVEWTTAFALRDLVRLDGNNDASLLELVALLERYSIQLHHPSYMGHQVCPPFPAAVLGDLVVSALNQSVAVWEMSPIGTVIEKEVIDWLRRTAGYPETSTGTTVSGGSAANLTGLMAARARWQREHQPSARAVILCSADAHYSVARAASIMGIGSADVIKIATDAAHRMDIDALEQTLAALEATGVDPLAIVATSGSTATGAFDRLDDIAALRDRYRTWLHVDAAHGASTLLSDSLRHLVAGLSRADSFSWDPHKMMWMPLSLGVILVRDPTWLRLAFEADAPYLFNAARAAENLGEVTIQCSRRADAIKLWLTLKTSGLDSIKAALDRVTATTRQLFEMLEASDDFEPLHEPQFNILCFRFIGKPGARLTGDELTSANERLREGLIQSGQAWITTTLLKGIRALRVTLINPATGPEELRGMLDALRAIAAAG